MNVEQLVREELNRLASLNQNDSHSMSLQLADGQLQANITQLDRLACAFESFSYTSDGGLPPNSEESASALPFSRPAQRSLRVTACLLAESLKDPLTSGSCSANILLTVPTATDWNDPCRMGFSPTEECDLSTAH